MIKRAALVGLEVFVAFAVGCGGPSGSPHGEDDGTGALARSAGTDEQWVYDGPLPMLESPTITVSLQGHTVRVSGLVPEGTRLALADLPHVRVRDDAGRTRLDAVYPIATARPEKTNATPGDYGIAAGKLFRPDGAAVTAAEGQHFVTWGGFPFLPYDGGIALHGPITAVTSAEAQAGAAVEADPANVWALRRGRVSGGCNRMMGEHVVEVANLVGFDMHVVHKHDAFYARPGGKAPVTVLGTYDTFDGKAIDVDYPTDTGAVRPSGDVEMFGSWVATRTADGSDLPANGKWEAGVRGRPYVFARHARHHWVCAVSGANAPAPGTKLPAGYCADK